LLVDERGVPLSAVVTAANVNDHVALPDLLSNPIIVRQKPSRLDPQHLCLDAAFDNETTRRRLSREYYVAHIAPKSGRGDEAPPHEGGLGLTGQQVGLIYATFALAATLSPLTCPRIRAIAKWR